MAKKKEKHEDEKFPKVFAIFMVILFTLLCVGMIYQIRAESYTQIDGEWLPNTPMPTPTSSEFALEGKIYSIDRAGDEFWGFSCLLVIQVEVPRSTLASKKVSCNQYAKFAGNIGESVTIDRCTPFEDGGRLFCWGEVEIGD